MSTKKLYDQLFNLLGTGDDSLEFKQVLQKIGEPNQVYEIDANKFYQFNQSGFEIVYDKDKKRFWMLGCEYSTKPVKDGTMVSFPDDLYGGIKSTDTPKEIEEKLGVKPNSFRQFKESDNYSASYNVSNYVFKLLYENNHGPVQGMTVMLVDSQ